MKAKSVVRIVIAIAAIAFLAQCGGGKKESAASGDVAEHASGSDANTEAGPPQFTVDATFQSQLAHLFTSYVKVKDAFVESDPAMVKNEATTLKKILRAVETKMLSGVALNDWSNYAGLMNMALAEIVGSGDIEVQRTAFSALSDNLYKSIKAYGLGTATAYYDFCPMAFNDQGAYWLSDNKEIRNPYFGDKMLTCGRVTETLR